MTHMPRGHASLPSITVWSLKHAITVMLDRNTMGSRANKRPSLTSLGFVLGLVAATSSMVAGLWMFSSDALKRPRPAQPEAADFDAVIHEISRKR